MSSNEAHSPIQDRAVHDVESPQTFMTPHLDKAVAVAEELVDTGKGIPPESEETIDQLLAIEPSTGEQYRPKFDKILKKRDIIAGVKARKTLMDLYAKNPWLRTSQIFKHVESTLLSEAELAIKKQESNLLAVIGKATEDEAALTEVAQDAALRLPQEEPLSEQAQQLQDIIDLAKFAQIEEELILKPVNEQMEQAKAQARLEAIARAQQLQKEIQDLEAQMPVSTISALDALLGDTDNTQSKEELKRSQDLTAKKDELIALKKRHSLQEDELKTRTE